MPPTHLQNHKNSLNMERIYTNDFKEDIHSSVFGASRDLLYDPMLRYFGLFGFVFFMGIIHRMGSTISIRKY